MRRTLSRQSKRLVELVDTLLDLSRLEADSISIDPVELDVRERVVEIAGVVAENGITIDVPDGLHAVVDPQAFDRIVSNLLLNARSHGEPPITVSARRSDGELSLTVEDRGPGIAAEDLVGSCSSGSRAAGRPRATARGSGSRSRSPTRAPMAAASPTSRRSRTAPASASPCRADQQPTTRAIRVTSAFRAAGTERFSVASAAHAFL